MELFGIVRKMHEHKRQNPFKDITTKRTKKMGYDLYLKKLSAREFI